MSELKLEKIVVILVIGYLGAKFAYPLLDRIWKSTVGAFVPALA